MARPSRETTEQQGRILLLIDTQTDAAPLEDVSHGRSSVEPLQQPSCYAHHHLFTNGTGDNFIVKVAIQVRKLADRQK